MSREHIHKRDDHWSAERTEANDDIERDIGEATLASLNSRGHRLTIAEPQTVGRMTAASRDADGVLRAGATMRLQQAYAIGR